MKIQTPYNLWSSIKINHYVTQTSFQYLEPITTFILLQTNQWNRRFQTVSYEHSLKATKQEYYKPDQQVILKHTKTHSNDDKIQTEY